MAKCLAEMSRDKPTRWRWAHVFFIPQCSIHEGHGGPHKDEIMQEEWEA